MTLLLLGICLGIVLTLVAVGLGRMLAIARERDSRPLDTDWTGAAAIQRRSTRRLEGRL